MPIITPKGTEAFHSAVEPTAPVAHQAAAPSAEQPDPPAMGTPEHKKPEEKEEALSPKYLALARQQKAMRKMQQDLKEKEERLKAQEAEYQSKFIQKDRLKEDPFGVFSEVGLSYDDIVAHQLKQDPISQAMKPLASKISEVEKALEQSRSDQKRQQEESYKQALEHVRSETRALVESDPEFETIKASDAVDAVVDLIKETFDNEGKLLTVKEAASMVEQDLFDYAVKLMGLEKVKKKFAPAEDKTNLAEALKKQQQQQPVKTLTNAAVVSQSRPPLTAKERRERAIMAFRGELSRN